LTRSQIKSYFKTHPDDKQMLLGTELHWDELFADMDVNGDGTFDVGEFSGALGVSGGLDDRVAAAVKVTPAVIAARYNISGVTVRRNGSPTQPRRAVTGFDDEWFSRKDLSSFFKAFVPSAQPGDDNITYVGDKPQDGAGGEAQLDVDYITGPAPGIRTEFWAFEGNDFCQDVFLYTAAVVAATSPPAVHSMSYGFQSSTEGMMGCGKDVLDEVEHNLAQIAARGVAVIVASGDDGSAYNSDKGELFPSWPASSPWVTAVGGTGFSGASPSTSSEAAATRYGSGGGFSPLFNRSSAAWQERACYGYIASSSKGSLPPPSSYTASGRGTPDVSMISEGFQVSGGIFGARSMDGTSASTPAFASIISLLNEARDQAGKPPLGFLNPFLYANADAFTDIVDGDNKHGRGGTTYKYGWECTKGWDPVTGLGTPKFAALLAAALAA